ncbi:MULTISPECIES: hypothetical protein [unclassified Neochlamydia]|uniref:hypothetical protein n=1 Tax=unclassified Neochlamydia TaxID=2643326 RepID=UPI00140C8A4F|nr:MULTISPECIES: hypothetical protein [unclassified Neochlamydia]MBS4171231.1 Uncharacterized protein [Neochlamydia sp. AcF95]NGY94565.1 hypothetical protein [Neochlamydia sp. AcF84]
MGVDILKGEVFYKIVAPSLEEEMVKQKATSLGISELRTLEEKNLLTNSLARDIQSKISDYLNKQEVLSKNKHLKHYKASSLYKWSVLEQAEKAMETIYPYASDENLALSEKSSK